MPVDSSYHIYITDQLEQATTLPIRSTRMFSGLGFYAGELFFAILMGDTLYLKTDESNRADYESAGMEAFALYADKTILTSYYQLPEEVLEDTSDLEQWVAKAVAVVERAPKKKRKSKKKAEEGLA